VCENPPFTDLIPESLPRACRTGTAEVQRCPNERNNWCFEGFNPGVRLSNRLRRTQQRTEVTLAPYASKSVPQRTSVRFVCLWRAVSAVLSMVSDDLGVSTI
jgi:hypothetical protein